MRVALLKSSSAQDVRRVAQHAVVSMSIVGALLSPGRAWAVDDPNRPSDRADALFERAQRAMDRGDAASACADFAESQRLDPAVGTELNLGECSKRLGRLAIALTHFQSARAQLAAGDPRIPFAEQSIAELGARVPRVAVQTAGVAAPGMRVQCNGAEIADAQLGAMLPVDPGRYVCDVRAPGHAEARAEISIQEGERRTIVLTLGPPIATSTGGAPARSTSTEVPGRTQRVWGVITGGVGAVGMVVGGVLGLAAKSTYDDALLSCQGGLSACSVEGVEGVERAHAQALASTLAFVLGGALVVGGVVLYLTAPTSSGAPAAGLSAGSTF
jgi:hypothetical protein